jgi:hypothetical protein
MGLHVIHTQVRLGYTLVYMHNVQVSSKPTTEPSLWRWVLHCDVVHSELDGSDSGHRRARSLVGVSTYPPIIDGVSVDRLLERQHQS